jgi:hypothetical protein
MRIHRHWRADLRGPRPGIFDFITVTLPVTLHPIVIPGHGKGSLIPGQITEPVFFYRMHDPGSV